MTSSWQRTVTCGELRREHVGQQVILNGWVHSSRHQKYQSFIDLRDRYGRTQVVFDVEKNPTLAEQAQALRNEFVISVTGVVMARMEGKTNSKLATGEIEVQAEHFEILNRCEPLPFEVSADDESELAAEEIRLNYRYLDLRRQRMQDILWMRHKLCHAMRQYLDENHFLEIETPILGKSTPEGARDYLVPSRVHEGKWYALPQSPQLYKQILMVAGYDRYYQIARCFRDEDLRANRQPEFTQLDIEMSFVDQEDVMRMIEGLTCRLFSDLLGVQLPQPFPRITYADAMAKYGVDRPDLRYDMTIRDVTMNAKATPFEVFANAQVTRALNAKGLAPKISRKGIDELTKLAREHGAKGLTYAKIEQGEDGKLTWNSPVAKLFAFETQHHFNTPLEAEVGDLLLFISDDLEKTHAPLHALRTRLGKELELYDPKSFHVSWCVDFPMFAWDEEENRYVAQHHPFTALHDDDWQYLDSDPGKVRAKAYDLIINGEEAGGGTIRIHRPDLQQRIFEKLGLSPESAQERFGFLLDAFRFGAPPHGGIAFGLDRWVMLLAGLDNIRDCIAFPKTQRATDLMTGAPSQVEEKQLRELHLRK